jgi:hypothetical protein
MKRISWETSSYLKNECGCLKDGVVTVVHGHMMTMSVCSYLEGHPDSTSLYVVDVHTVEEYYGTESKEALDAADWVTAVCFEDKSEAMLWFTNNIHKRLLMTELHDQDLITFLSTIPEQTV